jgi:hypothetical protein
LLAGVFVACKEEELELQRSKEEGLLLLCFAVEEKEEEP